MSQNVDTLKAGYEAFARGDLDEAMKDFDDGIRWENPNAPALPNAGVHEGKDKVREVLASTPQYWDEFRRRIAGAGAPAGADPQPARSTA